jgi:hypothetical protein
MNLTEAAHRLGVSARTLRLAVERARSRRSIRWPVATECFTGMGSKRKPVMFHFLADVTFTPPAHRS